MATPQGTRAEDFVEAPSPGPIDPSPLAGTWYNTDKESRGIVRIVAAAGDGIFTVQAFGAFYDHGFLRTHLQAKVNRGVLVVAMFNEFTDGSGRSSYFTREFYHR